MKRIIFQQYLFILESVIKTLIIISIICSLMLVFLFVREGYSAEATLSWDPNSESDLAGYNVYYGTSSRSYVWNANVGNETSYTISQLEE